MDTLSIWEYSGEPKILAGTCKANTHIQGGGLFPSFSES